MAIDLQGLHFRYHNVDEPFSAGNILSEIYRAICNKVRQSSGFVGAGGVKIAMSVFPPIKSADMQ
jgi:hypothetical protein